MRRAVTWHAGAIQAGDAVLLDSRITGVASERIGDAQIALTMVGGKVVYRAGVSPD